MLAIIIIIIIITYSQVLYHTFHRFIEAKKTGYSCPPMPLAPFAIRLSAMHGKDHTNHPL